MSEKEKLHRRVLELRALIKSLCDDISGEISDMEEDGDKFDDQLMEEYDTAYGALDRADALLDEAEAALV